MSDSPKEKYDFPDSILSPPWISLELRVAWVCPKGHVHITEGYLSTVPAEMARRLEEEMRAAGHRPPTEDELKGELERRKEEHWNDENLAMAISQLVKAGKGGVA